MNNKRSLLLFIVAVWLTAGIVRAERIYTYQLSVGQGPNHDYSTINEAIVAMNQKDPPLSPDRLGCIEVYPGTYQEWLNSNYEGYNNLPAHCDLVGKGGPREQIVIKHYSGYHKRNEESPTGRILWAGVHCDGDNVVNGLTVWNFNKYPEDPNFGWVQNGVRFEPKAGDAELRRGELVNCEVISGHGPAVQGLGDLVVRDCKVSAYFWSCISFGDRRRRDETASSISDCTLVLRWHDPFEGPTGINACASGRIERVNISAVTENGSYAGSPGHGWIGIALRLSAGEHVEIFDSQIDLELKTVYEAGKTAPMRVCGILSGFSDINHGGNFPGSAVLRDCTINVSGIEDDSDPAGDGAGIMVDGICIRGGGTVKVYGDTSITTDRVVASNAADGYEYLLNNENGTLLVDSSTVVFDPPDGKTNGIIDKAWGFCTVNAVVECAIISSDLQLKYSLRGDSGPWIDLPTTRKTPYPLLLPIGSEVWFQADVGSTDYEYREWKLYENGALIGGNSESTWFLMLGTGTVEADLYVRYRYTRQTYWISGTVFRCDGALVPGGVDLKLTSRHQILAQKTTDGSFSFTEVRGATPVMITLAADRYTFSPPHLVYDDLDANHFGETIVAHAFDDYVPMLSFQTVPPAVCEDSSVLFSWVGEDDVADAADLRYQYKLDGEDSDWSDWISDTSKSYELANGAYTFRVRVDEVGNMNQVPSSHAFIVNAAPTIVSAVRTNNSVWASRVTLQMPVGAKHPSNAFVLLPDHSAINDAALVPVRIHHPGDANACGANTIVANELGLAVLIEKVRNGWLVTLPESIPLGQTAEYDIVWGKIIYFGWQEAVSVPLGFPNGNLAQSITSYLNDDLRVWRMLTKKTVPSTYPDSWVFMNVSDSEGAVVDETIVRYVRGYPFDDSQGSFTEFPHGSIHKVGENIFYLWPDEKYEFDGYAGQYSSRYGLECFDSAGISLNTLDGAYDQSPSGLLMYTVSDRIWFTGLGGQKSLWFEARDWEGNLTVPRTTFESFNAEGGAVIDLSQASVSGIGDNNILLLWMRRWHTPAGYYRKQICYQVRNANGQLVRDTVALTPVFSDDIETDDYYWFRSFLTNNQGRVWIAYQHLQSGRPTEYLYVVLSPNGDIWKGPIQTAALRHFKFCDKDGYIWATENNRFLASNPDDTMVVVPRKPVWIPDQAVGDIAALADSDGYRLYDRWSRQTIEIDVPPWTSPNWLEIFDLNLWGNDLHPTNLILKKDDTNVWTHNGEFVGHSKANVSSVLNEGPNSLLISQDDFLGGQVLVTFGYVVAQTATVPDVVGFSRMEAESAIISAGLAVGIITRTYSDTVPAGHVITQNPVAGVSVAAGSAVDIVISDGPFQSYSAEQFSSSGNRFDLSNKSIMFTPTEDGASYNACLQEITQFPTDPAGGTFLSLGDDSYGLVTLHDQEKVSIYGSSFSSFYVGSNGYITFLEGDDSNIGSLSDHFDTMRISVLFDDFDPSKGGMVSWEQFADRVVVTWENIPEWTKIPKPNNSNTFQVELYFDGRIQLAWLGIDNQEGIVGLSDGHGLPADFQQTDLSEYPQCGMESATISGYVWTSGGSGISGVTVTFSNSGGSSTTDSSGHYSNTISYGWSGVVTPSKSGYTFNPLFRSYNNVTSDMSGQDYAALVQEPPDYYGYFTEQFSSGVDLSGKSIMFAPTGGGTSYNACLQKITQLPTDPAGGTALPLGDDSYELVTLHDQRTVSIYGSSFSNFYVGSNGYITFLEGDRDNVGSLSGHFDTRRISVLFDDFDPSKGGVVSWQQFADRVVVTWQDIPEWTNIPKPNNSNTFQVGMYFDGRIQLAWLGINNLEGIVGLSDGHGLPADFQQTDLSEYPECGMEPPTISGHVWTSGGSAISGVTLTFSNGGSSVTDSNGYYSNTVSYGSSGVVTPSKSGYTFNPPFRSYSNVTSDISGQDYAALAQELPDAPDFFTEQFSSGADLSNKSIMFIVSEDGTSYNACLQEITQLPTDPAGGAPLPLGDDSYEFVTLYDQRTVSMYGSSFSSFYVGSNGYITFLEGDDSNVGSLSDHFDTMRISVLFDDFDPSKGGMVSWEQFADRVVVTWENIPEWTDLPKPNNSNTFQVELYFDGRIQLAWLGIENQEGIVGLSDGHGLPADFQQTDLSEYPQCGTGRPIPNHPSLAQAVDFNGDGKVDLRDFCSLARHWIQDESSLYVAHQPFGNGMVDITDLAVFVHCWLKDVRLLAHWRLDEAEGAVAHDSAGDSHGTVNGEPRWQPADGKVAGALEFDGVDDYVSTGLVLNPAGREFSVFAWIKTSAPGRVIISQNNGTGVGRTWLCTDVSEGRLMTDLGAPAGLSHPLVSQGAICDGKWHHIGLAWDGLYRHLYVDGIDVAKDSRSIPGLESADGDLLIGAGNDFGSDTFWFGLIDDIRVYGQALNEDDITALAD